MAPDRGVTKRALKKNGVERAKKNPSLGRQIRDIQRLLKLNLSDDLRQAQESRLKQLKDRQGPSQQQQQQQPRATSGRNADKRYKQVRFIERRKVERGLRRAEKELKSAADDQFREEVAAKIQKLKQDLEYVQFFPKTEKYVSLFMENADAQAIVRREKLREMVRANVAAAAAAGVELEEDTGSEDDDVNNDSAVDMSDDDFFAKDDSNNDDDDEEQERFTSFPGQSLSIPQDRAQSPEIPQQHKKRKPDERVTSRGALASAAQSQQDHLPLASPTIFFPTTTYLIITAGAK